MPDVGGLSISLLGEFRLSMRGQPVVLPPSKKTRALLAYLVAVRGPHSRARLCDLLWDGPDDPRAALRWSLAKLRPLVDGDGAMRLSADREHVAFVPWGAAIDILALPATRDIDVATARTADLEAAILLFTGEFLEGLDLPGCFRFHEWCMAERERWSALRLGILSALVDRLRGTPEAALRYARARVGLDPLDEAGHVAVIQLLARLGRHREAVRQYEYCRQIVQVELGAAPGAELLRAFALLKPGANTPGRTAAHQAPPPAAAAQSLLVGRDRERAVLDGFAAAALRSAARPDLLLLTGPPGIGKTRLLGHLAQTVVAGGGQVLMARAFEAEMRRPYGIWADILRGIPEALLREPLQTALQPLIAGAAGRVATHEGDSARLYAAVLSLLCDLSGQAATAIVLDDLQWIDEASVSLLHMLLRAFEVKGALVIAAAARSGEFPDNKPASRLARGLARDGRLHELKLGPLDDAAAAELASSVASGRNVMPAVAAGEGNPLFTIELARALAAGGDALPGSIEGVLAEQVGRAEGAARALLPWAAALGRAFDIGLLARCVCMSPAEWDSALEELERRGIIRCIGADRYDFAHDLIRGVAYERISQPRRRLIHGQIAQSIAAALDADQGGAESPTELIRHAALGGNDILAARGCALAGESGLCLFANDEAIDFALRGMHHLSRMKPGKDRAALHISLLRIRVLASSGNRLRRWPLLPRELGEAVAAAESAGLPAEAATGYFLLSVVQQDEGRTAEARETTLRAAAAGRHADGPAAVAQLANTARCLLELESSVAHARAVLAEASARSGPRHRDCVELFWAEALHKRWEGLLDRAAPLMEEALQHARDQGDRWRECKCLAWLARFNLERGEADAALACCEELRPLAERMGESGDLPFVGALEALSRLALGMPGAIDGLGPATDHLRAFDSKAHLAFVLNMAAASDLAAGRFADARAAAAEALAAAEATRHAWESAISRALLARIHAAQGDPAGARQWLEPVLASVGIRDGLSAAAQAAVLDAAASLGLPAPAPDQVPDQVPDHVPDQVQLAAG